jgi:hypothetical protein
VLGLSNICGITAADHTVALARIFHEASEFSGLPRVLGAKSDRPRVFF